MACCFLSSGEAVAGWNLEASVSFVWDPRQLGCFSFAHLPSAYIEVVFVLVICSQFVELCLTLPVRVCNLLAETIV